MDTPRLRTVLPSGAVVYVERMTGPGLGVCLQASARGVAETSKSHGFRHLLEHLLARRDGGSIDGTLEAKGLVLSALTTRDATKFQIDGPNSGLETALSEISKLLAAPTFSEEQIRKECLVIGEELALEEKSHALVNAAWTAAFDSEVLSPAGTLEAMMLATSHDLEQLHKRHFCARNLVLTVVGDVDVNLATELAKKALKGAPQVAAVPVQVLQQSRERKEVIVPGVSKIARAIVVEGLSDRLSIAKISAGMAIANEIEGSTLIYTPSLDQGLLIVIAPSAADFELCIEMRDQNLDQEFRDRGQSLLLKWLKSQLSSPALSAAFRSMLLRDGNDVKPETLIEFTNSIHVNDFRSSLDLFSSEKSVMVRGKP